MILVRLAPYAFCERRTCCVNYKSTQGPTDCRVAMVVYNWKYIAATVADRQTKQARARCGVAALPIAADADSEDRRVGGSSVSR